MLAISIAVLLLIWAPDILVPFLSDHRHSGTC
jgi:hypothetical protein